MLPSTVLTHLKAGVFAAFGPLPVLMTEWEHPTSATARKQANPSEVTSAPDASAVLESLRIASLLNALTRRRMI